MRPREAVLLANDTVSDITETSWDSDDDSDFSDVSDYDDDDDYEEEAKYEEEKYDDYEEEKKYEEEKYEDDYDDEGSYMTSAELLANLPLGKVMGF
jgi:hypothetical protein